MIAKLIQFQIIVNPIFTRTAKSHKWLKIFPTLGDDGSITLRAPREIEPSH
jgi:hypothetical protein